MESKRVANSQKGHLTKGVVARGNWSDPWNQEGLLGHG